MWRGYPVEGAPGLSLLATGEEEADCRERIHSGNCPPLCEQSMPTQSLRTRGCRSGSGDESEVTHPE